MIYNFHGINYYTEHNEITSLPHPPLNSDSDTDQFTRVELERQRLVCKEGGRDKEGREIYQAHI